MSCNIPYMCNLEKKVTNELIYKIEVKELPHCSAA